VQPRHGALLHRVAEALLVSQLDREGSHGEVRQGRQQRTTSQRGPANRTFRIG
jgi:hypothetical protein